ncbi:Pr6Pr family membrane protein [Demequina sp. NBRC 110057]|uniref:Pr6Pr family membrane protein n=1 Tax=Demequina sp. NBRC 110057 TaxID=1570346 RepID=UPI000A076141|nr:Pr6Pr family membrane protein [Demequina sp. NBRC 110057]
MSNDAALRALRLTAALAIALSLAFQGWADLTHGTFTWGQLPGYFTPLAAIAGVVSLTASAIVGERYLVWLQLLRVNAATYLAIAGVVYWAVLAHYSQPYFPWANAVLHGGAGIVLTLDWLLVGRRRRLPVSTWWTVLWVPAGWAGYLLLRAARDGWVPYPFLDPARGFVTIATTLALIAVAGLAFVALLHCSLFLRRGERARADLPRGHHGA